MILAIVALVVGLLLFSYGMFKFISHVERTRPVPSKPKMTRAQARAYLKRKSKP